MPIEQAEKKPKRLLGLESTKEGGGDGAIIGEVLLQRNIVAVNQQLTLFRPTPCGDPMKCVVTARGYDALLFPTGVSGRNERVSVGQCIAPRYD